MLVLKLLLIFEGIIKEGEELAKLHPQIVVKVPMIKEGFNAIKYFSNKELKQIVHLFFFRTSTTSNAKAGATYVSPFIGRLDDIGKSGIDLVAQICHIYKLHGFETQVLLLFVIKNTSYNMDK